jgi:hypothetical protein
MPLFIRPAKDAIKTQSEGGQVPGAEVQVHQHPVQDHRRAQQGQTLQELQATVQQGQGLRRLHHGVAAHVRPVHCKKNVINVLVPSRDVTYKHPVRLGTGKWLIRFLQCRGIKIEETRHFYSVVSLDPS